jgi:hypothetical protein
MFSCNGSQTLRQFCEMGENKINILFSHVTDTSILNPSLN